VKQEWNVKDRNNDGSCSHKLGELAFGKDKESVGEGRGFEFEKSRDKVVQETRMTSQNI
jgi:hypothetical protein